MIFLIYYLDKILNNFLLQVPVRIEDIYIFPSQSSCTDKQDDSILDNQDETDDNESEEDLSLPTTDNEMFQSEMMNMNLRKTCTIR